MEASAPLEKLRPCGRLETYSTARHHLGFYNNVGLTATYTTAPSKDLLARSTSSQGESLRQLVFAALHHVIAEHPNLGAVPVNEEKSFPNVYFARLPKIDLTTCVEFHTRDSPIPESEEADSELDKLLRLQHSRNFKGTVPQRPYWRLAVSSHPRYSERFTASWIFHHALSDGASSTFFHDTFLEGLNNASVSPQANVDPLVRTPSTLLAPALEDLHPMTISWPFLLRAVAGSLLSSYFTQRPIGLWTGSSIEAIAQTPVPSHVATIVISAETTKALAAECRSQRTSVTAALSTLLAAALFRVADPACDTIKIDTPISLRPLLSVQHTQMVNAITNQTCTFHRTTDQPSPAIADFFWAAARRAKSDLSHQLDKKGTDNPIALLKYVSNMHDYFVGKLGARRATTAEVSNLGVYRPRFLNPEMVEHKAWSMHRLVFSQSANCTGPLVSLSAVTGADGCLVLSFTCPRELSSVPDMMKQALSDLVHAAASASAG